MDPQNTHHTRDLNDAKGKQLLQDKQKIMYNRSLDPTGMFRNRGRHVVAHAANGKLPQDRAQGSHGHANESSVLCGDSASNNQQLNDSDNNRVRVYAYNSSNDFYVQSSGAPSKEEDDYVAETRIGTRNPTNNHGKIADLIHEHDHSAIHENGENTSQHDHNNSAQAPNDLNHEDRPFISNHNQENEEDEQYDQDGNDSTVSIMGSIINDDLDEDEGLKRVDAMRWQSAMGKYCRSFVGKERMPHVSEHENEESDVDDAADNAKDDLYLDNVFTADIGNSTEDYPDADGGRTVNEHTSKPLLSQPPSDDGTCHNDDNPVNVSIECHVDTSLLDESQIEDENCLDAAHSNVVQVADFLAIKNSGANLKYSDQMDDDYVVRNRISHSKKPLQNKNYTSGSRIEEESPLCAAFRRTAASAESNIRRIASPRLPSASFTTDNQTVDATYHGSLLPLPLQLARKCFSFDDTTLADDAEVPYQPELGVVGTQTARGLSKQQRQFTEYYGLSAVASFPSDYEDNSLKKSIPLERTSRSFSGAFSKSNFGLLPPQTPKKHTSIRQSRTWDHSQNTNQVNNDEDKMTPTSDTNVDKNDQQGARQDLRVS